MSNETPPSSAPTFEVTPPPGTHGPFADEEITTGEVAVTVTTEAAPEPGMLLFEADQTVTTKFHSHMGLQRSDSHHNVITEDTPDEPEAKKLGTLTGVYLPCLQNILGVILFLRLPWLVGQGGVWITISIVAVCCCATVLTTFSMSAIVTNGIVPAGGPYYLISRTLGPEFGGAVGIIFYLGTTIAGSMYILGGVETVQRSWPIFNIPDAADGLWDMRWQGLIVLMMTLALVCLGIRFVSLISPMFLAPVIGCIVAIFVGIFTIPLVGNSDKGIVGLNGDVFVSNAVPHYSKPEYNYAYLLAIFFPSVTGIMAGSNRSGDLKNPSKSIPVGTLGAIGTTGLLYIVTIILMGSAVTYKRLQDEEGELVVAAVSVPLLVQIGVLLSTFGAGLQSLTGAPRLLQAIAKDAVIPILERFAYTQKGEPRLAQGLTALICGGCCLIGSLDSVVPLVSMFFLLFYAFVNFACFVLSVLNSPGFRPRWKAYHWSTALAGSIICIVLMFIISPLFAGIAIILAAVIYKYIERQRVVAAWGDGLTGLRFQQAKNSLLAIPTESHVKNWRPQILLLTKLDTDLAPHPRMAAFVSQLKRGKGFVVVGAALEGSLFSRKADREIALKNIQDAITEHNVVGFPACVVAKSRADGMTFLVQNSGLGPMEPNTVMIKWPNNWRDKLEVSTDFVDSVRLSHHLHKACVVVKGANRFPLNTDRVEGEIHVWWIVEDGGLLLLLAFLLRHHKVWRKCSLKIFTVAQMMDNSVKLHKDLETFLYNARIDAEVEVVEMDDVDLDEYTYERTMRMEEREKLLKGLKGTKGLAGIADAAHTPRHRQPSVGAGPAFLKTPQTPVSTGGSTLTASMPQLQKMANSVKLNQLMTQHSGDAKLVVVNLPTPQSGQGAFRYMAYLAVLSENLDRVLMVKGGGMEVVTVYN